MKEDLSVFHMHDYYPGFAKKGSLEYFRILDNFKRAILSADLIIACSEALLEEARALGRTDAKLVDNGVDYDKVVSGLGAPIPFELAGLPRPIVGHIGRINRKLEMDAISRMARERPDWSVVLIGPRTGWPDEYERRFQALLTIPNVHYLDGRGWDELPAYFNALDVGLMAYYTEGTWMAYGSPLKVWEYFSIGKPVVSADVLTLRKYPGLLHLVPSGGDWSGAVEAAIKGDTAELRQQRQALARQHGWDSRAQLIEEFISDALTTKVGHQQHD